MYTAGTTPNQHKTQQAHNADTLHLSTISKPPSSPNKCSPLPNTCLGGEPHYTAQDSHTCSASSQYSVHTKRGL